MVPATARQAAVSTSSAFRAGTRRTRPVSGRPSRCPPDLAGLAGPGRGRGGTGTTRAPRVRGTDDLGVLVVVPEPAEQVAHGLDPGALLVVALDDGPRRVGGVGVEEHGLLRLGVLVPPLQRGEIGRGQLPLPYRVHLADDEPGV